MCFVLFGINTIGRTEYRGAMVAFLADDDVDGLLAELDGGGRHVPAAQMLYAAVRAGAPGCVRALVPRLVEAEDLTMWLFRATHEMIKRDAAELLGLVVGPRPDAAPTMPRWIADETPVRIGRRLIYSTLLHEALRARAERCITLLLEMADGADFEHAGWWMFAAARYNPDHVRALVARGFRPSRLTMYRMFNGPCLELFPLESDMEEAVRFNLAECVCEVRPTQKALRAFLARHPEHADDTYGARTVEETLRYRHATYPKLAEIAAAARRQRDPQ